MLAEVCRWTDQGPAFTALQRDFAATDRIHHAGGRVRAVFHRQAQFQVHGNIAPLVAFQTQEAQLVVLLPGNIVRGANVDILVLKTGGQHGLHRFGLGRLLAAQTLTVQHVHKVGVAAGVQLIGALHIDAARAKQAGQHAVDDGGADLSLDVVTDDGDALFGEFAFPLGAAGDEHRHAVDHGDAGFQRAFHVELGGVLAADGQEVQQHLGARRLQRGANRFVGGLCGVGNDKALVASGGHVVGDAVQLAAHHHLDARCGNVGMEDGGAVGAGEDRLGNVLAHFARVDIDAHDEFHITRAIAADGVVDQTLRGVVRAVIGHTLDQRACAIAHADHSDLNWFLQFDPSRQNATV